MYRDFIYNALVYDPKTAFMYNKIKTSVEQIYFPRMSQYLI